MFKYLAGIFTGVALTFVYLAVAPSGTEKTARAIGHMATEKIEKTQFEICERKFLDETHCYQDPKMTADLCDARIRKACR